MPRLCFHAGHGHAVEPPSLSLSRLRSDNGQDSALYCIVLYWFEAAPPAAADKGFARFRSYIPDLMVAALCEARWSRLSKSKAAFLARRSTGAANVPREAERGKILAGNPGIKRRIQGHSVSSSSFFAFFREGVVCIFACQALIKLYLLPHSYRFRKVL